MMERALKERIIGAVVLVLVVVLVVPVFLDGPPSDEEIVSKTVPLPGQADQKTQTVVLDRDRDEPVPAAAEPAAEPTPEPTRAEPQPLAREAASDANPVVSTAPEPAPRETGPATSPAASSNSSPTGMWAVQLGSFGSQENAERLAADLRKQGFAAFLSKLSTGSGDLHRVRIGPQKDRESAEAMAERLLKAGHKGQVVPHP